MDAFAQYGVTTDLLEEAFPFFIACDPDFRITMLGASIQRLNRDVAIGSRLMEQVTIRHESSQQEITSAADSSKIAAHTDQTVKVDWLPSGLQLVGRMSSRAHGFLFLVSPSNQDHCDREIHLWNPEAAHSDKFQSESRELNPSASGEDIKHYELKKLVLRLERAARDKEQRHMTEKELIGDLEAAGDLCIHFDANRIIVDIKAASQSYLGTNPARFVTQTITNCLPSIESVLAEAIKTLDEDDVPKVVSFQLGENSNGYQFDARLARSGSENYVLLARDVTERCELEERLQHRTLHDTLTGLANRKQFQLNACHALQAGKNIAILLADMDDFKSINDSLGEDFGDSMLRILGDRIRAFTRDSDTAFRTGADEFAILLSSDCPLEFAESVAYRLTEELCQPIKINGVEVEPQVSIGLALGAIGQTFDATIRDAGFALELAKVHKRSSVVVCDDAVRDQLQERNTMKREISRAIRQREFVAFYQPIIDLQSKRIVGFESLVRWDHPTRGMLSPFFFLEIAEETGAIVEIGELILEQACRDLQELTTLFPSIPLKVNVNLASQQVQDLRLITVINDVLERTQLDPKHLTLEITETALIDDFEKAKRVISNVRKRGIQVALDDFGAGHSSLTYLQQLPIDYLKLDRALISSVCESESQHAITDCVTRLGKALNLKVVAEGIETSDQDQAVTKLGCDMAQGFLFSKPVPLDQAIELLVKELAVGAFAALSTTPALPAIQEPSPCDAMA
ncbi:EAL domain-containing protein [Stieleria marina]|uniref:Phytochrome-like protein cph2 n=1 Tax=Stieleria marina TaxID=1930275 RepID=A0A517NR28_9BACT|nr:Phytochrome-like protein cph2 [Planctomycetes bacterium K23_9]